MGMISKDKLRWIAGEEGFNLIYLEKDYFLTLLLRCIRDVDGIYLKGGTATNKILLDYKRLSEDLDFTCERDIDNIIGDLRDSLEGVEAFTRVEGVSSENGYSRFKVFYESYFQEEANIVIDLNRKASLRLNPEKVKVPNFYDMNFEVDIVNKKEIVAEKIRALITRNQPRDYFDVYFLLEEYDVDCDLVKKKVEETDEKYDKERIFRNAQKVYTRWEEDLEPLVREKLKFKECIQTLKKQLE